MVAAPDGAARTGEAGGIIVSLFTRTTVGTDGVERLRQSRPLRAGRGGGARTTTCASSRGVAVSTAPRPFGLTPSYVAGGLPSSGRFRFAREASPGCAVSSVALADGRKGQDFVRYHRADDARGA